LLASSDREVARWPLYNRSRQPRLCWPVHQFAAAMALLGAVAAGGCSLPLDTMFEKAEAQRTGSVTPLRRPAQVAPTESDLAYAGAVAVDAFSRGGKDSSIPWENPQTGAGGSVTPLASAYSEGVLHCRDFLASYVKGQSQAWLKGEACRTERGKWEVKSFKQLGQG